VRASFVSRDSFKYKMRERDPFFFSLFFLARDLSLSLFSTSSLARRENTKLTHLYATLRRRTTEWTRESEEKEDVAQWEDDWDDTEADDFKTHLREELKKNIRK